MSHLFSWFLYNCLSWNSIVVNCIYNTNSITIKYRNVYKIFVYLVHRKPHTGKYITRKFSVELFYFLNVAYKNMGTVGLCLCMNTWILITKILWVTEVLWRWALHFFSSSTTPTNDESCNPSSIPSVTPQTPKTIRTCATSYNVSTLWDFLTFGAVAKF